MSSHRIMDWNGKLLCERAGEVSVDTGQIVVIDPCCLRLWSHGQFNPDGPEDTVNNFAEACRATLTTRQCGPVLRGLGVAIGTAHGDGTYPVYVQRNRSGGISKVLIDFEQDMEDEEGE